MAELPWIYFESTGTVLARYGNPTLPPPSTSPRPPELPHAARVANPTLSTAVCSPRSISCSFRVPVPSTVVRPLDGWALKREQPRVLLVIGFGVLAAGTAFALGLL